LGAGRVGCRTGRGGRRRGYDWRGRQSPEEAPVKTTLDCPCGTRIVGENEDELVEKTQAHLAEKHPQLEYDRDAILFMAF
jgi:hypothetical protein